MKQDDCTIEESIPIGSNRKIAMVLLENHSLQDVHPSSVPLIDQSDLKTSIDTIERKPSSIISTDSHEQNQSKISSQIGKRLTGIFYAIIAAFFFTCSIFIIKQLPVDFFDALLSRFILQTVILLAFVLYKNNHFIYGPQSLILLQLVRMILGTTGYCLFYFTYRYIPLPDLTTYRYTQVIWTAIFGIMIFRERISISTVIAVILTIVGVVLVAQPTFLFKLLNFLSRRTEMISNKSNNTYIESNESNRVLGLCFGLACAVSISFSITINKKLMISKVPQSVLMFQYSSVTLVVFILNHVYRRFILNAYQNQTMFTWQFGVAASVSLLQLLSMTLTQRALKFEQPSIISIVQSSDIVFALALQNLFSNVKSNWFVVIGSLLVTASIFLVGIHRVFQDQKKHTQTTAFGTAKK